MYPTGKCVAGNRDPAVSSGYRQYCLKYLEARQRLGYGRKKDSGAGAEFEIWDLKPKFMEADSVLGH